MPSDKIDAGGGAVLTPCSTGELTMPLYFASYCAECERAADPMASISVDIHIPDVGLFLTGVKGSTCRRDMQALLERRLLGS